MSVMRSVMRSSWVIPWPTSWSGHPYRNHDYDHQTKIWFEILTSGQFQNFLVCWWQKSIAYIYMHIVHNLTFLISLKCWTCFWQSTWPFCLKSEVIFTFYTAFLLFLLHFLLCMWAGRFSRRSFLCHTSSPLSEGSPEKRKSLKLFICWISEGKTLIMWRSWSSPSPLICFTIFTLMARPWVTPQQELAAVLVKSMSFPGGRSKPFKNLLIGFLSEKRYQSIRTIGDFVRSCIAGLRQRCIKCIRAHVYVFCISGLRPTGKIIERPCIACNYEM